MALRPHLDLILLGGRIVRDRKSDPIVLASLWSKRRLQCFPCGKMNDGSGLEIGSRRIIDRRETEKRAIAWQEHESIAVHRFTGKQLVAPRQQIRKSELTAGAGHNIPSNRFPSLPAVLVHAAI